MWLSFSLTIFIACIFLVWSKTVMATSPRPIRVLTWVKSIPFRGPHPESLIISSFRNFYPGYFFTITTPACNRENRPNVWRGGCVLFKQDIVNVTYRNNHLVTYFGNTSTTSILYIYIYMCIHKKKSIYLYRHLANKSTLNIFFFIEVTRVLTCIELYFTK